MPFPPLVLASTSPARRKLCADVGLAVEAVAAPTDESAVTDPDPTRLALRRAEAKARAVADLRPGCVVIGADQVAWLDGEVFGKPLDPDDHLRRLRSLRGRLHHLTTGVALVHADRLISFSVDSGVRIRADLEDAELAAYVATGEGAGSAGGYEAEHRGASLVEAIEGDWLNVLGLPVFRLQDELRRLGWRPFTPA